MNKRRDQLRAMFGAGDGDAGTPEQEGSAPAEPRPKRGASGAVRAMGLELGSLSEAAGEAQRLRETLANGERIAELDPARIDAAPIADRFAVSGGDAEAFERLKKSIADHGQQVPVLVRPHPDDKKASDGGYQAAYGHRRIEAARQLGFTVGAVVRRLTDAELVIAQGKENAERHDLSFIERALFAKGLIDGGFERAVAQDALSVHKSEMTRLLQVAEAIPSHIARAIGPAPKVGRPRWLALGAVLQSDAAKVKAGDEIARERFRAADSDQRFQMLLTRLSKTAKNTPTARAIRDESGQVIATFTAAAGRPSIAIDAKTHPGFAEFVAGELPRLSETFRKANTGTPAPES